MLPQKFTTVQILITDKNGKTLKQQSISGSGKGTINVDASALVAGAYNYSLIVDGRVISPITFNNLTKLEYLYASINDLSGPIPSLSKLKKSESLNSKFQCIHFCRHGTYCDTFSFCCLFSAA